MRVLIAGCGDLGTEAGLRFAAAGFSVLGWRRSPGNLPAAITGQAADLTGELPRIPAGTDVVVIAVAAGERTEAAYRAAYVDGTANVMDALERDGVRPARILFVSSTAVYGDADGGQVDEDTPPAPASATGAVILEAEQLLHDRRPDAVVLRLAGIYGPGRTRLIDAVTAGTAVIPAGSQLTNRIHRDDAAAAIVHLTTRVSHPAPIYVGVDKEPVEMSDVLHFLAGELGHDLPAAAPASSSRGGNRRLSSERLSSTGFDFAYPTFRDGYRAVLAGEGTRHP
ncbi:SDR family oxidoreductase [Arthrobacter sp. zg-Y20]|uniref:SDR family oxidoreductase n=1 Tax=unclassified Arthrobacter TaxID=235627 RepID=UPI001D1578F2|nr:MULTISPECIES: SDR family oxidoreductase [unclassified Arthrobacter]MCC3277403.1 SDR family oxidoreductase [Arthrobacter sp. zg-Y20]MDK1317563.1 SDR family oxidoreductase [Arthrobacter sp. zg.Y20]WIB06940.1 SDR family oxidoreductase [Arthrobacter sp. zg-Y20]